MRRAFTSALLLGLALAVLAPAFAAASAAPDCRMACCRLGTMPMAAASPMSGTSGCPGPAPCSMRGCGGAPPVATLAGLPPSVLPAVSPLPAPAPAAPPRETALHPPASLSLDLPDQPPRA